MSPPRWFCAAVGLKRKGKIVVIGGRDDDKRQSLKSIEMYHIRQQVWEMLEPSKTPRYVLLGTSKNMIIGVDMMDKRR
jgi:hypothetical protein